MALHVSEDEGQLISSHSEVESDPETVVRNGTVRRVNHTEKMPLINRSSSNDSTLFLNEFDDAEFASLVREVEGAIDAGVDPERIYQGSSGSYFAKNRNEDKIGVFKPKDEEPYGQLNPKWTKWLHKLFLPCCFGRSCLVPNQGYLSEAGASLVDEKLGLNVVPKTKVVYLASEAFNYHFFNKLKITCRRFATEQWPDGIGRKISKDLPLKVGSLQTFVTGYRDACVWLEEFRNKPLPPHMEHKFQLEFERLVVLDYIIRNTDRGSENWLIHCTRPAESPEEEGKEAYTLSSADERQDKIKIAAIDNGLAFPFKHPDEWRNYPFQWMYLPVAKVPFSDSIVFQVLAKLESEDFVQSLVDDLRREFKKDKGFDRGTFEKQMAVMRGQILNLKRALQERRTPYELVEMLPTVVQAVKEGRTRRFIQKFRERTPFFKGC